MYREIKEREQEEARRENELKSYKEELIRLEKERLLREYIDELAGFMPKGMLSNLEEAKYLKNSNPQTVRTGYASNFKIYWKKRKRKMYLYFVPDLNIILAETFDWESTNYALV